MLSHRLVFDGEVEVAASSLMSQGRLNLTRYLKNKGGYMLLCYITFIDNEYTLQSSDCCVLKVIVLTVFTKPI